MTIGLSTGLRSAPQGSSSRWWVLAALECGNFVVYMDAFIVTLALPAMARYFGVGIHEIKWVLVAYLTALTVTLLPAGRLADRWGRKPVTVVGVALLTLGAALCALAPSLPMLIVFRIVQGLGGALVLANVMAEITAIFPREERRRAMAINASVLALGQITGLLLGGFVIDWVGWRAIYLVIVAIGGLGVVLDVAVLRNRVGTEPSAPMDKWGALLSILIVGVPFLLMERLSRHLFDLLGLSLVVVGLILVGLFVRVERHSAWPLLDLRLFRLRGFICGSIAAAFYFIVQTFGYFLLPLYVQVVLGLSPSSAGLAIVPLSVALTVSSQLTNRLARGLSARLVSTAGLACTSIGVFGMSFLGEKASYSTLVSLLILAGVGGGLFQPPNNSAVLSAVPPEDLGGANGFFTTARNFGQALGAALAAALLGHGVPPSEATAAVARAHVVVSGPWLDAYVHAQAVAFRVAGALGLMGAVISAMRGSEGQAVPPPARREAKPAAEAS